MNDTIIKTENLRFTYAEAGEVNPLVLDGVSLNIEAGTFVAVLATTAPASPPWPST